MSTDPTDGPEFDLEAVRAEIPVLGRRIPLANCSHTPLGNPVRRALDAYRDSWDSDVMDWDAWMDRVDAARAGFAGLIGAAPDEIAVTSSVTVAAATIASCFDLTGERDRVTLTEAEFPTVGHVWLGRDPRGCGLDWVPLRDGVLRDEDWERAITERTRLVCACHAYYVNGFEQDLAAIARRAHARGALVFTDAYQTAGIRPIDVKALDVDFLAAGAHKFLMGTPGIAFLYVRRELIEQLEPALTGWFGRADIFAFDVRTLDWADTAERFELSTPPVPNAYAAAAGIEWIRGIGVEPIRRWTEYLGRRLVEGGAARGLTLHGTADPARKTPVTAFLCSGDSADVEAALRERGVVAAARGPVVRLAPHFFNSVEDVDGALDALADVLVRRDGA